MKSQELTQNNIVSFKYNGRNVTGRLTFVGEKSVMVYLHTDYKGKNQEWCKGEVKECYISLMKRLRLAKP